MITFLFVGHLQTCRPKTNLPLEQKWATLRLFYGQQGQIHWFSWMSLEEERRHGMGLALLPLY
jgi:hypothetical protein